MWLVICRDKGEGKEVVVISFDEIVSIWREGNKVEVDSIYVREIFDIEKDKVVVVDSEWKMKLVLISLLMAGKEEFKGSLDYTLEYVKV